MANELNYYGKLSETGLTVTARVYNPAGTQVGADVTCVESGSLAIYRGDMPAAAAGEYGVRFFNGSVLLGQGTINWDGTKERLANLDATVSTRSTQASIDTVDTVVDAIKAKTDTLVNTDLSGINTKIDTVDTVVDAIKAKTDTLENTDLTGIATTSDITALNNISVSEVLTQVQNALNSYDAPTKAELDAAQSTIETAITNAENNITAQDIWNYLQSEPTVSGSLKEAVEVILKNAKLIPASI